MVEAVGKVVNSVNAKASLASESLIVASCTLALHCNKQTSVFFGTPTKEPTFAALNQVAVPVFMEDALRVDAP